MGSITDSREKGGCSVGTGYSTRRSVLARDTAPGEEINLKYLTKSNITNLEGKKKFMYIYNSK